MPTLHNMEIPKPQNWQEFEQLVESYARINWPGHMISLFGGAGQNQHGVDIYIKDSEDHYIGIQCKKVARLTYNQIEKEIEKAKSFKPALKHYYIAVSTSRNAALQEKVNILNSRHSENGLFTVDIIFWEDIIGLIISDGKAFELHYPQLSLKKGRDHIVVIHASNNKNSIIGNNISIKTSKNCNTNRGPIQDTIGCNTYMKNYAKHLIDRYHDFKKANISAEGGKMNYSLIYNSIKRKIGFKWDEIPYELFGDLCTYLQKRIDDTLLGKNRKRSGAKNYSTYIEYLAEKSKVKLK